MIFFSYSNSKHFILTKFNPVFLVMLSLLNQLFDFQKKQSPMYLKFINRLYLIRGLKKIAKEKKKIKSNFIAASHDDMIMITGA